MLSEKLCKDHLRLFVRACVRQSLSKAETLRCLAPLLRDFEQSRDLTISDGEVRRMIDEAIELQDASSRPVMEVIGRFCTGPTAEERERMRQNEETAARKEGRGTPLSPIDLTRATTQPRWFDEAPAKGSGRRRKRANASV